MVALTTVKEAAAVPPKATAVAPVKLVPVMVTDRPRAPAARGEGGDGRRRDEGEGAAAGGRAVGRGDGDRPVAPLPTVAVIEVALTTVKDAAAVPPKATAVAPVKLVPVMVTIVPVPPLLGVNEVMVGAYGSGGEGLDAVGGIRSSIQLSFVISVQLPPSELIYPWPALAVALLE